MTQSEGTDIASLTAKCSKILEVLEEGRKTAGGITGGVEAEKEVAEKRNQVTSLAICGA